MYRLQDKNTELINREVGIFAGFGVLSNNFKKITINLEKLKNINFEVKI